MKKMNSKSLQISSILPGIFSMILIFAFASCGGGDGSGVTVIETSDVKGKAELSGASWEKINYNFNGTPSESVTIDVEGNEITIFPQNRSFAEVKEGLESKAEKSGMFNEKFEILENEPDYIFFQTTKRDLLNADAEPRAGWGFIRVVKKDDSMNYFLESRGKSVLEPIFDKAQAEKMLKIARSFIPG